MSGNVFALPNGPGASSGVADATAQASEASEGTASKSELQEVKNEVKTLKVQIERLEAIIESQAKPQEGTAQQPSQQTSETLQYGTGTTQSTAVPENPRIAIATKAQGGDLSGAGNLLRTDRITIGGYGDFQFRESSISERADGGGTPTFQNTRFVLGVAAVLAERQNIVFNSEIEYEFGSREIDLEQAFVEWKVRPEFAFRGGIFVPALGRFNVYHDSNLNLLTIRPLINQFIVPTAYRDAGMGVRGRITLPHKMKLSYEADVLNGMQGLNADGTPTPFSRLLGQSSAAEPGRIAFQSTNRTKAVASRIGISPISGLEFGGSVYNGKFSQLGDPSQSATIVFLDGSYHHGPLAINGEYAHSNIVGGGIPRRSPAPPVVDPNDPATVNALAQFVAQRSPGQDGFYVEGAYQFSPRFLTKKFGFDEGSYIAPVFRYEVVRLDRTIPNFYLNRSRTSIGFNVAPTASVIFKMNYLFNHSFGPVPRVTAAVGGANFGVSPLPHLEYGKNGFTGSVAYVF
ncbi:MAG TPA: hypothetical protein VK738_17230 [Terriglobales bacterium]|nr:hypothetical protein [Terriglobales bacterium]